MVILNFYDYPLLRLAVLDEMKKRNLNTSFSNPHLYQQMQEILKKHFKIRVKFIDKTYFFTTSAKTATWIELKWN